MTVSTRKSRSKPAKRKSVSPETPRPSTNLWTSAFADYRALLLTGLAYVAAVTVESWYCGVPLEQYARVGLGIIVIFIKCIMLLVGISVGVFARELFRKGTGGFGARVRGAHNRMANLASRYLDGQVFAYGCVGILVLFANDFYFIQKSLVHVLHPYAWDDAFIALDRALHFGHFPHEFVIALSGSLHLGRLLDDMYFIWFAVMYLGLGYNLFWDNNLKRRLRFLWCFLLSWIVLGSVMAVWFSAAGPLFYHDFFPHKPSPYSAFVAYFHDHGPHDFPIAYWSGLHLLSWTTNGQMVNLNAVAAFPSMHIAIAWLTTLYGFSIRRSLGIAGVIFSVMIYLATVLFGYHYALDGYVSLIAVSLMWWAAGRLLERRYPGDTPLLKRV